MIMLLFVLITNSFHFYCLKFTEYSGFFKTLSVDICPLPCNDSNNCAYSCKLSVKVLNYADYKATIITF